MPQVSPMYWFMLMLYFLMILYLMMLMIFFYFNFSFKILKFMLKFNNFYFKWY